MAQRHNENDLNKRKRKHLQDETYTSKSSKNLKTELTFRDETVGATEFEDNAYTFNNVMPDDSEDSMSSNYEETEVNYFA